MSCKKHGDSNIRVDNKNVEYCRICHNKYSQKYRNSKRLKLIILLGGKCCKCGYDKYYGALDFHHKNGSNKNFEINSTKMHLPLDLLEKEAKKCLLLCANCHREIHKKIYN